MDPWGTPHLMVCSEEQGWLIWTNCWRQEKVRVKWSNSLTFSKEQLDGTPIELADTFLLFHSSSCEFADNWSRARSGNSGRDTMGNIDVLIWNFNSSGFEKIDIQGGSLEGRFMRLYLCSCSIKSLIFPTRDDSKFRCDQSCLRLFTDSARRSSYDFP